MKLKLITREPADHLRHWAGYQAAIFDGAPTEPTERLVNLLRATLNYIKHDVPVPPMGAVVLLVKSY